MFVPKIFEKINTFNFKKFKEYIKKMYFCYVLVCNFNKIRTKLSQQSETGEVSNANCKCTGNYMGARVGAVS
jgi:hypothetical protein